MWFLDYENVIYITGKDFFCRFVHLPGFKLSNEHLPNYTHICAGVTVKRHLWNSAGESRTVV